MNFSKVKTTIGIFFALLFFAVAISAFAQNNSSATEGVFNDSDQDGLSNEEEIMYGTDPDNEDSDGDGYMDGVEVSSGYDPLKPAPGDKIIKEEAERGENESSGQNTNLTKKVSNKLAELMNSDDPNISMDEIDDLINVSLNEDIDFEDLPEVDESRIKVKKQDYSEFSEEKQEEKRREDSEEYLTALSYMVIENSPHKISSPDDLKDFENEVVGKITSLAGLRNIGSDMEYFEKIAGKGENLLKQMDSIEVPGDMLDIHKKGIQIITKAVSLKDEIKIDPNDPIGSIASVSKAQGVLVLLMDFQEEVEQKLEDLEIEEIELEI